MSVSADVKLRTIGPLVLFLFGTIFFRINIYFELELPDIILFDVIALLAGFICWQVGRWAVMTVQKKVPGLQRTQTRLLMLLLILPLLVNFSVFLRIGLQAVLRDQPLWPGLLDYTYTAGVMLFYNCVYITVYEGIYLFRQWQQTYEEKEQLLKTQWRARFDTLKSQVNPHFLFNSLNTLSALIAENPSRAEEFVEEMSTVYRYLLQTNERELTTLRTELAFTHSYFNLLKTRYGTGLALEVAVLEEHQDTMLPPLTLQMLIENAVKHNVILTEQPLHISIRSTADGRLVISNNLQRRSLRVESNQVGLSNIASKYRLLAQPNPTIEEVDAYFSVTLPLILPHNGSVHP
ncbi:hypothetical protein GCM10023189_34120 [Nibrella saemangeumensis]|uniref:Signal transduction histidine kinase internal region domain-containing protein n=1 Tax=Nibrella saemangeumensis TaxID=1084526 RepID=A0ABP8N4M9_9BACT